MEKNSRAMDHIAEKEQKNHVLMKYILGRQMKGKMVGMETTAIIREVIAGTDHVLAEIADTIEFANNPKINLSIVLARFIELQCSFISKSTGNWVELKVDKVAIAKVERAAPRFQVTEEGFVKITNIVSSKTIIEANMFNIPTLVRVNFDEYKRKLAQNLSPNDIVSVDVFTGNPERSLEVVKKTKKIMLLEDCQNAKSYEVDSPGYINYLDEIDDQIPETIRKYKDKQILSEIILPVIYINESEEEIPIGYVWIQSKETRLTSAKVDILISLTKEMVERIKDANLMTTEDKFPVLDVSSSGLRIRITLPALIETLPKQKLIMFDVFFKMQAPFRLTGAVAWHRKNPDGALILGIAFTSKFKSAAEKHRYEENIEMVKKLGQT